ncbi:MAG TPA: hypothetical protein EYP53_01675 [Candidatus Latescibacteria bacterium]|nr:hypothetical protein [Candidatus Latescibacterota bacterium]
MGKRQFNTDCEGPISRNDNAMELAGHFIPDGEGFFARISRYDDYLSDIARKPGYKAGDTLRLILPFLRAYGATNKGIEEYSARHILLMPGAREALDHISRRMPTFMVSTSYRPYIRSLCKAIGFPLEKAYCTELDIDRYDLKDAEVRRLKEIREEIACLPIVGLPPGATSFNGLPGESREAIRRLDAIFWQEISTMECGKMLSEVNPIGGREKVMAVMDSLKRTGNCLQDVMYVGDSITDVEAFDVIRTGGGLTVSFNGNRYAIRSAEFACISGDAAVLSILAESFLIGGKDAIIRLADDWNLSILRSVVVPRSVSERISRMEVLPVFERISDTNRERLIEQSESFRKSIRGEEAGSLG